MLKESQCDLDKSIVALVVPTRNRASCLARLFENLSRLRRPFNLIIVVDSSDTDQEIRELCLKNRAQYVYSSRASAAHQRNLGIEIIRNYQHQVDYVAFLDDDVQIPSDYLNRSLIALSNPYAVGVSGLAINLKVSPRPRTLLTDLIGLSGEPGCISKALINIPCTKNTGLRKTEWLIGCSVWKIEVIQRLEFQDDFGGNSLFEDVIFSFQARRFGDLYCNTDLILEHSLEITGRPEAREHFESWVVNRYRLLQMDFKKSNSFFFWLVIFIFFTKSTSLAIMGSSSERNKAIGLLQGFIRIKCRGRK